MSTSLEITMPDLDSIHTHFAQLQNRANMAHLLDLVGETVVSQTQRRIHREKTSPAGKPWEEWSETYAAHQHGAKSHPKHPEDRKSSGNHALLELFGNLVPSITYAVSIGLDFVEVGSNLVYAATHQYGRYPIPARPYLGLSERNKSELGRVVDQYLETLI